MNAEGHKQCLINQMLKGANKGSDVSGKNDVRLQLSDKLISHPTADLSTSWLRELGKQGIAKPHEPRFTRTYPSGISPLSDRS